MSDDEFRMYNEICQSYDKPPSVKGADLFVGLIETDDQGLITFIKPPSARQTSLECYLFVCSLFQHQQARLMQKQVDDLCSEIKAKAAKLFKEIKADAAKTFKNKDVADKLDSK